MRSPHVDDWGTPFAMTIYDSRNTVLDLSSASPITIIFTKPDSSQFVREASFVTDGTDGKIEYTIQDGEIDTAGDWKYQGRITFINGSWSTDLIPFVVEGNE
jgi:hypothetical protein